MNYLLDYGFDINELNTIKEEIKSKITKFEKLVKANIDFLKNFGVENYQTIFVSHAEMFLMDNSEFEKVFKKYDHDDLIEKLKKNPDIVEQL